MPSPADPPALDPQDLAACAALLRGGSRSFHAASLVLPRRVRDPAVALYAFCRLADDAVDGGADRVRAVEDLRARLDRAYAGRPDPTPADRAFAVVAARFAIPRALPDALIEGFAWDAEGRRYETLDDLVAYAVRVAGTVGAMMAVVMGERGAGGVARACDLGVAMQLTNIARDVGEDARLGRIYLPLADLRRAGVDPDAFLADPRPGPALAGVVARLLAAADELYARSEAGVAGLPADCRPAIQAARRLYAGIGREVERRGGDSVTARAVVPGRAKAALLARALLDAARMTVAVPDDAAPPLPQARFVVDAVAVPRRDDGPETRGEEGAPAGAGVRLLALFERLERTQRLGARPGIGRAGL
jgi:phytoene synthase